MHDIDKTLQELDQISSETLEEIGLSEEGETDFNMEMLDELPNLAEENEIDLASELLTVSSDQELDQFLGNIFKKIKSSPIFKAAVPWFKKIAKKALPIAGKAIGAYFGGPVGAKLGGSLGQFATRLFEVDLEGLSPDDRDMEIARRYVRFATAAADKLSNIPPNRTNAAVIKQAIKDAAQTHAPGLVSRNGRNGLQRGRWIRRGNRIILLGV